MYVVTTSNQLYRKSPNLPPIGKVEKEVKSEKNLPTNPIWRKLATNIQPKLIVSVPSDPQEQEADQVADRVMRMSEPGHVGSASIAIQRKCTQCEDEEKK